METTLNKITGHIYFVQNLKINEKINFETKVIAEVLWGIATVHVIHQHSYSVNIPTVTCELHLGLTYLNWRQPKWNITT
jgi:hypothetical protein